MRHGDRVLHRPSGVTATVVGVAESKKGMALWIHVDGTLGAMVPTESDLLLLECIGHQTVVSVPFD